MTETTDPLIHALGARRTPTPSPLARAFGVHSEDPAPAPASPVTPGLRRQIAEAAGVPQWAKRLEGDSIRALSEDARRLALELHEPGAFDAGARPDPRQPARDAANAQGRELAEMRAEGAALELEDRATGLDGALARHLEPAS